MFFENDQVIWTTLDRVGISEMQKCEVCNVNSQEKVRGLYRVTI
jgi:hypothetical protein